MGTSQNEKVYEFGWIPGTLVSGELLTELSVLYSGHYGRWSESSPRNPGRPIRLSETRIREWLSTDETKVATARFAGVLVGYAIAVQTEVRNLGIVSWATQLVVHADHRINGIGKTLLFSIWGLSDHFAWGLLTPNPFAIRALEKATRRRCRPSRIQRDFRRLLKVGSKQVPYVKEDLAMEIDSKTSRVNSEFFVDHTGLVNMIAAATKENIPWIMGDIREGWEWFAFTFQDQRQISLSPEEIRQMLSASDQVAKIAYSKMLKRPTQPWARHTDPEAELIIKWCRLQAGQAVLDFGCGSGRHAFALSKRGFNVIAVDYLTDLIEECNRQAVTSNYNHLQFFDGDCRNIDLNQEFDAAICLYDVVGTYVDNCENLKILSNLFSHLRPGGRLLLSVMNAELTKREATSTFSFAKDPQRLLSLSASNIMEKSGDIFDPRYYLIDIDTNVVYRKEQFKTGHQLPIELIVRDKRFDLPEIIELCKSAKFRILWAKYVNAGGWASTQSKSSKKAKEILVLCERES